MVKQVGCVTRPGFYQIFVKECSLLFNQPLKSQKYLHDGGQSIVTLLKVIVFIHDLLNPKNLLQPVLSNILKEKEIITRHLIYTCRFSHCVINKGLLPFHIAHYVKQSNTILEIILLIHNTMQSH